MIAPLQKTALAYLVAVFAVGLAAGGLAGFSVGRAHFFAPPTTGDLTSKIASKWKGELRLSPDQATKAEPLARQTAEEVQAAFQETGRRLEAAANHARLRLAPILTGDQLARYDEMQRKWTASFHPHDKANPPTK